MQVRQRSTEKGKKGTILGKCTDASSDQLANNGFLADTRRQANIAYTREIKGGNAHNFSYRITNMKKRIKASISSSGVGRAVPTINL